MLKTFFRALILSMLSIYAFAQNPNFQVNDADSSKVRMNQLEINVKIVGNIAYTNVEMHFQNSSNREMEGELLFPLPEGISVSHYAIDINGKMRDAVPVKKSKGKQVFEAIQNRRVDPGLLEKVDGNNFRTRVYPIPAGGKRIVQIGYEEELKSKDKNNLIYRLLSNYPQKLDVFKLSINVLGSSKTPVIEGNSELKFTSWNQNYSTSFERKNYLPKENFEILIPIREEIPAVFAQHYEGNNYFYTQFFIDNKILTKKNPQRVGIIFDNSLSCRNRNIDKELELLKRYFEQLQNVSVSLFFLNYDFKKQQDFTIRNGQADSLLSLLKKAVYDGGTRYSKINLPPMDEYLFFTDGLSSLSDKDFKLPKTPLYTVCSSTSADYSYLNKISTDTSADFINLSALSVEDGLHRLMQQSLRFLGIKDNLFVTEVYPAAGTLVGKSFSIAGISLKGKNEITLLFGYGNQPSIEKKIALDTDAQQNPDVNIYRLWAQKKIAFLDQNYNENQEAIETLGNKTGIATRNTSLIVLETLDDYIRYEIVPPAELIDGYDRVMKERREGLASREQSNWQNVESYFKSLKEWWDKDITYTAPPKTAAKEKPSPSPSPSPTPRIVSDDVQMTIHDLTESDMTISNITVDDEVVYAYSIVEDTRDNRTRETEARKSAPSPKPAPPPRRNNTTAASVENNIQASEVPVTFGSGQPDATTSVRTQGTSSGNISQQKITDPYTALDIIKSQPKEKQYDAYLQLREEFVSNPTYYFETAYLFKEQGDNAQALLILSSIADLGLENHSLYKTLTYVFREWGAYPDALYTARQVAKWRDFEPQSFRDLALTLEDNGKHQEAFDMLIKSLETNYLGEMSRHYSGIEDVILMDINRMISEYPALNTSKLDKKYLTKMPVDLRVILNWNLINTDIDLHVIEPSGEKCYYSNKSTRAGGRFSKDFTTGYGPEQYLLKNKLKGKYVIKSNFFGKRTFTETGPASVFVEIYVRDKNGKIKREYKTILSGKVKQDDELKVLEF